MTRDLKYTKSDFLEIQIEVTSRCPLDCIHCSSFDLRNKPTEENCFHELVVDFMKYIYCNKYICLTGGEPLTLPNLIQIIEDYAQIQNTTVGLFSCGCYICNGNLSSVNASFANRLKTSGLERCYISMYSFNPELHNKITNKESYYYSINTIYNLLSAGIDCKIHLPITKYISNNIESTIKELSKLGVSEVRLLRLVRSGAAINNWDVIGVDYDEQDKIINNVINNEWNINVSVSGYPEICSCRTFDGAMGCQAGINLVYIENNGNVIPCASLKGRSEYLVGHIKNKDVIINYINQNKKNDFYSVCLSKT